MGVPGFKNPAFAILIFFWIAVKESERQIIVFLVLHRNTKRQLQGPKPFSGLRKCEISGAYEALPPGSPPRPKPGPAGGLIAPLHPQFTGYGISPNSSPHY